MRRYSKVGVTLSDLILILYCRVSIDIITIGDMTCDVTHSRCSSLYQTCPCCLKKLEPTSLPMKSLYREILFLEFRF